MHIFLLTLLAFSLFLGRKTLAYVTVGPFFWIEFFSLAALVCAIAHMCRRRRPSLPKGIFVSSAFLSAVSYLIVAGCVLVWSGFDDPKELILCFYVFYFLMFALIFSASNRKALQHFRGFWVLVLPLIPLLIPIGKIFLSPLLGEMKFPGGTFVYPVAFALSLFLIKNPFPRYFLASGSLIFVFLSFERASFVNLLVIFVAMNIIFLVLDRGDLVKSIFADAMIFIVFGLFLLVFIFPLFDFSGARYSLNLGNFLGFIESIFLSDGSFAGPRNHRLEMWGAVLSSSFSGGVVQILFGNGFEGAVSDTSFRAIHNDYISIFYRTGLVGLSLYLLFLGSVTISAVRLLRHDQNVAVITLVVMFGFASDAVTGTIITSPFLSVIVYTFFAFSTVWSYRLRMGQVGGQQRLRAGSRGLPSIDQNGSVE